MTSLSAKSRKGRELHGQESRGKRHRGQLLEAVKRDDLQVVLRTRLEVARPDFCSGKYEARTRVPG